MIAIGVALCIYSYLFDGSLASSYFNKKLAKEIPEWLGAIGVILIIAGFIKFLWIHLP